MTEQVTDAGSSNTDTSTSGASADSGQPSGQQGAGGEQPTGAENPAVTDGQPSGGAPSNTEPASTVPESYSFEAPEGFNVDNDLINGMTPVFKELGLSQEQASKLVQKYNEQSAAQMQDTIAQSQTQWETELRNDPDFGGDNFDTNAAQVAEFVAKTIPEDMKDGFYKTLNETGMGSHPAFVKYMFQLSKMFPVGEDSPTGGTPNIGGKGSPEERMYGTK